MGNSNLWVNTLSLIKKSSQQFDFNCKSVDDFNKWKEKIIQLIKTKISFDSIKPAHLIEEKTEKYQDRIVKHCFFSIKNEEIEFQGIMQKPNDNKSYPLFVVCGGHNSINSILHGLKPVRYPNENIAEFIVRQGFTVISLDYGINEINDMLHLENRNNIDYIATVLSLLEISLLALLIRNYLSCLYCIQDHEWIKSNVIRIFGRSAGAYIALHLSLLYENYISLALSSFLGSYKEIFTTDNNASSLTALPGILNYTDLPYLAASVAPKPMHIQHGEKDQYFPYKNAENKIECIQQCYDLHKANGNFEFIRTKQGHGTDIEILLNFINRF